MLRQDIEYIVHCESDGRVIGPISKTHAHLPGVRPTLTHFSTWSMVYNPKTKKYGIQRKNPKKHDRISAGKRDMGVAGHNCYINQGGEWIYTSFSENLAKEAEEEIGLQVTMFDNERGFIDNIDSTSEQSIGYIFDTFHYQTEINNERVGLGLILTEQIDLTFTDNEVIDFQRLSEKELSNFLVSKEDYCSPLKLVFDKTKVYLDSIL